MPGISKSERIRRDALYAEGLKPCTRCGELLTLDMFGYQRDGYKQLKGGCDRCCNAASVRWVRDNRESRNEVIRKRRKRHPWESRLAGARYNAQEKGMPWEHVSEAELIAQWTIQGIAPDKCAYCPEPAEQLEHIQPLSKGGGHVLGNLAPSCARCNRAKSSRGLIDFLADRAEGKL